MLSKEETAFIEYWEKNRLSRKKIVRQFLLGVPIGLLFVIPILINLSSGWYKRAGVEANSSDFDPRVLFVALLLIVGFTAVFWQRHKWDQYEQRYRELIARRTREQQAQQLSPPAAAPQTSSAASEPPAATPEPAPPASQTEAPSPPAAAPQSAAGPSEPLVATPEPASPAPQTSSAPQPPQDQPD